MNASALLWTVCVLLTVQRAGGQSDAEWLSWQLLHKRNYSSLTSELVHRHIWEGNYRLVQDHNGNPDATFTMELNHLADQKPKGTELNIISEDLYLRFEPHSHISSDIPDSWDWRWKGAVTPVSDEGQYGSPYKLATENGSLVSLSDWEVYECCAKTVRPVVPIFQCIHNIGGLREHYPEGNDTCKKTPTCKVVAKINGVRTVPHGDEEARKAAVYTIPVLALVDASHPSFQLYKSGVFNDHHCSKTKLTQAMQVVGYDSEDGKDYWILKNSWGIAWGMRGYMYIARNDKNMCGIATFTTYPV